MPRMPHAAKQLFAEISAVVPSATYHGADPDGFGVYRTVIFEGEGTDRILQAVSVDPRIVAVSGNVAQFVTTTAADSNDLFYVARAHHLLSQQEPEPTLEERLNAMTKAEIMEEFGFESGTKKDMIAEVLADEHQG